jgi:hypothetical protein
MKKRSIISRVGLWAAAAALSGGAFFATAQAQDETAVRKGKNGDRAPAAPEDAVADVLVVSAKAGGLNLVQGKVEAQSAPNEAWKSVKVRHRLKSGDRLRTDFQGYAEMLLNPGSYLRLDNNSECQLNNAMIDSLHVTVTRGSAVFEVTGTGDTDLIAKVTTPSGTVSILRSGLYRVNVLPSGASEVLVWKGQIKTDAADSVKVKGRKLVSIADGAFTVADLDKNAQDAFDAWSKIRAESLIAANAQLNGRDLQTALTGYQRNGAPGFGGASSFGLWLFNGQLNGYTFFPFYSSWSSPYGFSYRNSYGLPWNGFQNGMISPGAVNQNRGMPGAPSAAPQFPAPGGGQSGPGAQPTPQPRGGVSPAPRPAMEPRPQPRISPPARGPIPH